MYTINLNNNKKKLNNMHTVFKVIQKVTNSYIFCANSKQI